MFSQKTEKLLDRQARYIAFLSQFLHKVEHVSGERNVVPDALSRLEILALTHDPPDLDQWAIYGYQAGDAKLSKILLGCTLTSLSLRAHAIILFIILFIYFDTSNGRSRLLVPAAHKQVVFKTLYGQSHGSFDVTCRLIKARFRWPHF